jgi:large subunit ribosomal protein L24
MEKLKKGDLAEVLSGKDAGKRAKIIRVITGREQVVLEGVNVAKKHQRATQKFQGGIIEKPMPLHRSKVGLICTHCNEVTRRRVCSECGEPLDKAK